MFSLLLTKSPEIYSFQQILLLIKHHVLLEKISIAQIKES